MSWRTQSLGLMSLCLSLGFPQPSIFRSRQVCTFSNLLFGVLDRYHGNTDWFSLSTIRWSLALETGGSASNCFLSCFLFPFTLHLFSTSPFVFIIPCFCLFRHILYLSVFYFLYLSVVCYFLFLSHTFLYNSFLLFAFHFAPICMICSFRYHISLRTTSETSTTAVHNHTYCDLLTFPPSLKADLIPILNWLCSWSWLLFSSQILDVNNFSLPVFSFSDCLSLVKKAIKMKQKLFHVFKD